MSRTRRKTETPRVIFFYGIVFLVVLLDQLIKIFMLQWLSEGQSVPVIQDIFHFTLVFNTGIAFGFFHEHPKLLFLLITASLVFLVYLSRLTAGQNRIMNAAMALILGGAVGNWIDRFRVHAVIDYLDFRVWPVFNLADSAITVGVILYMLCVFGIFPLKKQQALGQP